LVPNDFSSISLIRLISSCVSLELFFSFNSSCLSRALELIRSSISLTQAGTRAPRKDTCVCLFRLYSIRYCG
jgi:hypothetical protein